MSKSMTFGLSVSTMLMLMIVLASMAIGATRPVAGNMPQSGNRPAARANVQLGTIPEVAAREVDLKDFSEHIRLTGLDTALVGTGPYTVFAPTDIGFNKIPKAQHQKLMEPKNRAALTSILRYHVVDGTYTLNDLRKMKNGSTLITLEGKRLTITQGSNGVVYVDRVPIVGNELRAQNGVILRIDSVLAPPTR